MLGAGIEGVALGEGSFATLGIADEGHFDLDHFFVGGDVQFLRLFQHLNISYNCSPFIRSHFHIYLFLLSFSSIPWVGK